MSLGLAPHPELKARNSGRIATLDSLRAIVALDVVVHHVWTIFATQIRERVGGIALTIWDVAQAQSHRAVMAFFVLSGYTIALTTQGRLPVNALVIDDYLWRRLRRIVPLFYISLVWTAVLGTIYGYAQHDFGGWTLVGNMLFLQTSASSKATWFVPFGSNGPYWSLSYEMSYYLVLPLVLIAVGGRSEHVGAMGLRMRLVALGFVAMLSGLAMMQVAPNPFAAFATTWIVWIAGFVAQGLSPKAQSLFPLVLPALGCWIVAGLLALAGRHSATLVGGLEGTMLALVFGVLVTWRGWTGFPVVRLIDRAFNAAFAGLGRGSYALYLLHYPLPLALHHILLESRVGFGGWVAAGLLLFAFVVWFCPWIEQVSLVLFRPRPAHQK